MSTIGHRLDTGNQQQQCVMNLPELPTEAEGLDPLPTRKRTISDSTEDAKAEARRAANRKSAFESRMRRKVLIEDLQKQVADLTNEQKELQQHNLIARFQLESSLAESRQLRFILQQLQQQLGISTNIPTGIVQGLVVPSMIPVQQQQVNHLIAALSLPTTASPAFTFLVSNQDVAGMQQKIQFQQPQQAVVQPPQSLQVENLDTQPTEVLQVSDTSNSNSQAAANTNQAQAIAQFLAQDFSVVQGPVTNVSWSNGE
jgi:hypothetical protein